MSRKAASFLVSSPEPEVSCKLKKYGAAWKTVLPPRPVSLPSAGSAVECFRPQYPRRSHHAAPAAEQMLQRAAAHHTPALFLHGRLIGLKSGPHLCTPAIRARREFLCIHFPHLLQHQHYHTVREKGSIRTNKMFPLRPSASARRAIAPQLVRRRLHKKVVPLVPAFEQAVSPRTAPDHAIFTFFQLQRFPVFSPVHSCLLYTSSQLIQKKHHPVFQRAALSVRHHKDLPVHLLHQHCLLYTSVSLQKHNQPCQQTAHYPLLPMPLL